MPIFAEAANDDRWIKVYHSTYDIINSITAEYGTGILPDFLVKDNTTGKFVPAPPNHLESDYDGCYYYNSCRTPWRISMDYLINGNKDALAFSSAINRFIMDSTGKDPWEMKAGYHSDGTAIEDYNDLCFTAPFLISAACGDHKEWHDLVRDTVINYGDDEYFGDTIKMLCLIVDDGGWIVPLNKTENVRGDVNADGELTVADVVLLQKWLLCVPDAVLADWEAGDLRKDNRLDGFDLCLMKRMLIS